MLWPTSSCVALGAAARDRSRADTKTPQPSGPEARAALTKASPSAVWVPRTPPWYLLQTVSGDTEADRARALFERQRRPAFAIRATADAVWEWNLPTNKTYYSPRWFEMLGHADQAFEMTFDAWKALCHPDDFQATVQRITATLEAPQSAGYEVEFRMHTASGQYRWILGRGNVVERDASGRAQLLSGTNTDTTERKRARADRRRRPASPGRRGGRSALHECGRSQRVKGSAIRRASRWHGGRDAPRSLSGVRAAAARGRHRGLHRGALPGRLRRCERVSRDQASQSPTAGSGFVGLRQRRHQFLVRQQRHGHGLAFAQTNL